MPPAESALYERLIERDTESIDAVIRHLAGEESEEYVWRSVTRFALLAFAPSLHAMRALVACRCGWDLAERGHVDSMAVAAACARYAAESRPPWSEPPPLDPPAVATDHPTGVEELRSAVAEGDRLRAERWLAACGDGAAAILRGEAQGDARLLLDTAEALVPRLGEKGRHALRRTVVWGMAAHDPLPSGPDGAASARSTAGRRSDAPMKPEPVERRLERVQRERGSVDAVGELLVELSDRPPIRAAPAHPRLVPYRLARDFGQTLIAHAFSSRLPEHQASILLAAVHENLEHGESYADWSFA